MAYTQVPGYLLGTLLAIDWPVAQKVLYLAGNFSDSGMIRV